MMKDTILTVKRKKTEIATWLICFLIANLANLYAILAYNNTSFWELFTSIGYVFAVSLALYFLWSVIRILSYVFKRLFKRKK